MEQNWVKTGPLLLKILDSPISMDSCIVHWYKHCLFKQDWVKLSVISFVLTHIWTGKSLPTGKGSLTFEWVKNRLQVCWWNPKSDLVSNARRFNSRHKSDELSTRNKGLVIEPICRWVAIKHLYGTDCADPACLMRHLWLCLIHQW